MKTISLKTFALLVTFSLLTSVNYSLAAEGVKSSEALGVAASINTTAVAKDNLEDPDLKLSIEELRKKYPPSLVAQYKERVGQDEGDSPEEIKSAILNADKNFIGQSKRFQKTVDVISDGELGIIYNAYDYYNYFGPIDSYQKDLPDEKRILKTFLFSKKILNHICPFISPAARFCAKNLNN